MYDKELKEAKGFDDVFKLVKRAAEEKLGLHRAGLTLILADLPVQILAQHQMGSNAILMNRNVLDIVSKGAENEVDLNSYLFVVLLHEYLHSLGMVSEEGVRKSVIEVVEYAFGGNHPARKISMNPVGGLDLRMNFIEPTRSEPLLVRDFDKDSMPFIG